MTGETYNCQLELRSGGKDKKEIHSGAASEADEKCHAASAYGTGNAYDSQRR